MTNLRVTLLENCNRFVGEALRKAVAAETDNNQWQFAILLIIQAVELALKEKLHREHPLLVYANPVNPKNTVSTEQALLRLSRIPSVRINKDDKLMIELVVGWRNRIVHHEFDFSVDVLKSAFARLLGFLSNFYLENFNTSFREYLRDEEWGRVLEVQDYSRELHKRALNKLAALPIEPKDIWACIMCAGPFVINEGTGTCLACHYREAIVVCSRCRDKHLDWYTREIVEKMKDGHSITVRICDSCYEESID